MSSKLLKKQLQQLQSISNTEETQNDSDKSIEYYFKDRIKKKEIKEGRENQNKDVIIVQKF